MIKGLVIMNPRTRRQRRGKSTNKTMKYTVRRRRGVSRSRRNPPLSAAHKRKISLAVKRAMRSRKSTGKRSAPRRAKTRARTVTRTITKVRRVGRRAPIVRRVRARRRSAGLGARLSLGNIISKQNIALASGVIGSTLVSRVVIGRIGSMLPGATHPLGNAAYTLGISFVSAKLVSRFSRSLAEGLVIGGLVSVVNSVLSMAMPAAAVGEYLGAGYDPTMSLGPATQQMANQVAPAPQVDAYLDSQPAFDNSAW